MLSVTLTRHPVSTLTPAPAVPALERSPYSHTMDIEPQLTAPQPNALETSRVLDEWKVNVDLHKFHDQLKHQRITHCFTSQGALFAFYGLLLQPATTSVAWFAATLASLVAMLASIHVWIYAIMDRRARAFIDVVKTRLILLEQDWNTRIPSSPIETYTHQWRLLSVKEPEMLRYYLDIRAIDTKAKPDRFRKVIRAGAAHLGEQFILKTLCGLWVVLLIVAIVRAITSLTLKP
jgi:hypothetical protein